MALAVFMLVEASNVCKFKGEGSWLEPIASPATSGFALSPIVA